MFTPGRSGYEPSVNSTTREPNYNTHSLPPVSLAYKRPIAAPPMVRMPPGVVASIYDQPGTSGELGVPRSIVIQSQSGNIPLDSDSEDDVRYAVV